MKFEVDTNTLLQIVIDGMISNFETNAKAGGLSEEEIKKEIDANKDKIAEEAQRFAVFFTSLYVETPTESVVPE